MTYLKVCTLNIGGLVSGSGSHSREVLARHFGEIFREYSIACVQEVYQYPICHVWRCRGPGGELALPVEIPYGADQHRMLLASVGADFQGVWGPRGNGYFVRPNKPWWPLARIGRGGQGIYARYPVKLKGEFLFAGTNTIQWAAVRVDEREVHVFNIHMPLDDPGQAEGAAKLFDLLHELPEDAPVIVGGDFNSKLAGLPAQRLLGGQDNRRPLDFASDIDDIDLVLTRNFGRRGGGHVSAGVRPDYTDHPLAWAGLDLQSPPLRAARFVSQSVPPTMTPGGAFPVSVTMRNVGTEPWSNEAGHRLSSQNPADNRHWGVNRVALPHSVRPGEEVTIFFTVFAPWIRGQVGFEWRMVRNAEWFGDFTPRSLVLVTPRAPTTETRPDDPGGPTHPSPSNPTVPTPRPRRPPGTSEP